MKKLLLLLSIFALTACGDSTLTPTQATTVALGTIKYSHAIGGEYVSCSDINSNGDNYVSCTIQTAAGSTEEIVCSYASPGCKKK